MKRIVNGAGCYLFIFLNLSTLGTQDDECRGYCRRGTTVKLEYY